MGRENANVHLVYIYRGVTNEMVNPPATETANIWLDQLITLKVTANLQNVYLTDLFSSEGRKPTKLGKNLKY